MPTSNNNFENIKTIFWALFTLLVAVAIINVVFFVMPLLSKWANSFYPSRTIIISAEGKTTAGPDLADISFSVVSQGGNPDTLASNNNDKMNAVLQFVKSQGIADADVKTTNYNLAPNYEYDKNPQRNYISGYTLTQTVDVKVRDLSKVASVVGGLAPLGVNQIGNVNFTFADQEKYLAIARADAFSKAKEKAQEMAAEAGVSLGRVISVSEYGTPPVPIYANAERALGVGGAVAASVPTIEPGTQDITDQVSIVYEIR